MEYFTFFIILIQLLYQSEMKVVLAGKLAPDDKYPYKLYLDNDRKLELSWRPDYEISRVNFHMAADLGEVTWFGIGFSDYGEPINADFVIFWTSSNGIHHFQVWLKLHFS